MMSEEIAMRRVLLVLSSICLALLWGTGWTEVNSPLEVAEIFWDAVERGDADTVRKVTRPESLPEAEITENILPISNIEFGRIIIDGDEATVETQLTVQSDRPLRVPVETLLRREDGKWRVDYQATVASVKRDSQVAALLQGLHEFNERITRAMDESVSELERTLPELERQLRSLEREMQSQLPEWQKRLEEFAERMEEALQDKAPPPPPQTAEPKAI
jgi:exonuclease VII small subunit